MPALRSGSAGTTSKDPSQLTGCQAWWKADALGLTDGAAVTTWADSSGNGRTLTPASFSTNPIYRAAPTGFNGQPAVDLSGATDPCGLQAAFVSAINPANLTLLLVFQLATIASSSRIIAAGGQTVTGGYQVQFQSSGPNLDIFTESVALGIADEISSPSVAASTTYAFLLTFSSAGTIHAYKNGSNTGETVTSSGNAWDVNSADATFIGRNAATGNRANMLFAEGAILNSVLSAGDRASLDAYVGNKYGLTLTDVATAAPPGAVVVPSSAVIQRASSW